MSSRERLDMETRAPNSSNTVTFGKKSGCFVSRWMLAAGVLVAALLVIAVGLLVAYLTPCGLTGGTESTSAVVGPKPKPRPYVLLPRSMRPEHYDVELQPYLEEGNFTFDGWVRIRILVLQDTDNVTLHVNDMTVHRDTVRLSKADQGGRLPKVVSVDRDPLREFLVLKLDSKLSKRTLYFVEMRFTGNLNDKLCGFYRSTYKDPDGKTKWIATTQFEPTDARRAFPCFDEPAMKATFNITIVRPRNMSSLSNMPIYKTADRGDEWTVDYFERTVRMSTYLLAFIVSDFQSEGTSEFSVWSRKSVLNTSSYALSIGPKILKYYETFFDVKYPLPKLDMIAIPDFSASAMENWGLITYRETAMLYDSRFSSPSNKQRVAKVIAHEIAHQWFGNLVTMQWWDGLWLNEGFASYVEYLGVNSVEPDWMMDQQFVLNNLQNVMKMDALKTSHPIWAPVGHPDEINEIFDRISYAKGATIIRMMKFFLGDRAFQKGLAAYLKAKRYDNAVQDDLWNYLTAAQVQENKTDVKTVMDTWTLQKGFPLVTVTRNYNSGKATVEQDWFLLDKTGVKDSENYKWEIPFSYTDGLNPNWKPETKFWLHKTNGNIRDLPGPNYWVIGNVQQIGYYKMNYDDRNWKLLIDQLQTDHQKIDVINRAQIIDDSMDLARAGVLSYHLGLNATLYLRNEREYLPWRAALNSFTFIDSMLSNSQHFGKWKRHFIEQMKPLYEELGWEESETENLLRKYLRESMLYWMCDYEHEDCVTKAREKFAVWKQDPSNYNLIPPSLRNVVLCTEIRFGGEASWNFVWEQYKAADIASEMDKYMFSLACAREPWLLTRYLNWSVTANSGIRRQDGFRIFASIGSKLYGKDLTFNFLRDKWEAIHERYKSSFSTFGSLVRSVTSSLNTPFQLQQLKEFLKIIEKYGTAKLAFSQSLETVESNIKWMQKYYADFASWLDNLP